MTIEAGALTTARLAEYQTVSIAFDVSSQYQAHRSSDGSFLLAERAIERRYTKDYDVVSESPLMRPHRFDTSGWQLLVSRVDGQCVGGAAIAMDTADIHLLEGRRDLAVLRDMRVAPSFRGAESAAVCSRSLRQLRGCTSAES